MRINWKVRIKNEKFWLALIPAVILLIQALGNLFGLNIDFSDVSDKLKDVVNAVFVVLTILGVINDPTTRTLSDSKKAMSYEEPYMEEKDEQG
jgi:phi LC3 family holin